MNAVMLLFFLLVLACSLQAAPIESDVNPAGMEMHGVPPLVPSMEQEVVSEEHSDLIRERRSPGGWQPSRGGNNFPRPQPQQPQQPRGSISGGIHKQRGVGTIVHAQGHGNVWTSRDGRGRLDAHGQWSKVIRGPARSKPNYNVGITYSRRF